MSAKNENGIPSHFSVVYFDSERGIKNAINKENNDAVTGGNLQKLQSTKFGTF